MARHTDKNRNAETGPAARLARMMRPRIRFLAALIVMGISSLASGAAFACTNPAGVEGDVTYLSNRNVPAFCDGTNWIGMAGGNPSSGYAINAVVFNGTSTYLQATGLAPPTNSRQLTGSMWIKKANTTFNGRLLETDRLTIFVNDDGSIVVTGRNSGHTYIMICQNTSIMINDTNWHHVMWSFDLTNAARQHFYVDGADAGAYCSSYTNDVFDFLTGFNFGEGFGGWYAGAVADFWYDLDTYTDLSIAANREKFRSASGQAVYLGANGEIPNGTAPHLFFSGDTASWHTNKGTLGGFTAYGAALTTAPTLPPSPGGGSSTTEIVPSGLIGHWRLDEASGTTAADSSTGNVTGTMAGGMTAAAATRPGAVAAGMIFDGVDDRISMGDIFDFGTTQNFSISAWVKAQPGSAGGMIVAKRAGSNVASWWVGIDGADGTMDANIDDGPSNAIRSKNTTDMRDGQWHLLTATYDRAGNMRIFVDGVLADSDNITGASTSMSTTNNFTIAANSSGGTPFNGQVDDVRVYNRVLTADEVTTIYQARDGIRYNSNHRTMEYFDGNRFVSMTPAWPDVTSGLMAHWKLDETSGTTAADSSGNNRTLTMLNSQSATNDSTTGAVGRSLRFDGNDDVSYANDFIPAGQTAITISAWLKSRSWTGSSYYWIAGQASSSNTNTTAALFYDQSINRIGWHVRNASNTNVSSQITPPAAGEWFHIAATYDGANTRAYLNGVLVDTDAQTGAIIDSDNIFTIGRKWDSGLYPAGNHAFTFDGNIDDVRVYNRALPLGDIQALYNMGTAVGVTKSLPLGCTVAGQVCNDGTVYVGLSPDGNVAMFAAPSDETGNYIWGSHGTSRTTTNNDGDGNTITLLRYGQAAHPAAYRCATKLLGGYDDWYLPAENELKLISNTGNPVAPGIIMGVQRYWSSTQADATSAKAINMTNGNDSNVGKTGAFPIRCVRKGPAPRCQNPVKGEGALVYNTSNDVLQYCDGARWIAIGKGN